MLMKIVGAVGRITGSCTWCIHEETGTQFLVDCGMVQGEHQNFEMHQKFDFDPCLIKFVLLTHAHLDHCGMLPVLRARGFCGKIYCTKATEDLTKLQLQDCYAHMDRNDLRDILGANYFDSLSEKTGDGSHSHGKNEFRKFTELLVDDLQFSSFDDKFLQKRLFPISEDVFIAPLGSSHVLGATAFQISWSLPDGSNKSICFSGDVGSANEDEHCHLSLLRANQTAHPGTNYFVCESTYGDRVRESDHKDFHNRIECLLRIMSEPNYGTVIIPCFSMQRVQDVLVDLFYCFQKEPSKQRVTVYVDSPMAKNFCKIYREELRKTDVSKKGNPYLVYLVKGFHERFGSGENLTKAQQVEMCEKTLSQILSPGKWPSGVDFDIGRVPETGGEKGKKVIITSSGMCQAGRVLEHLSRLNSEKTALILTGFQATPNGRNLKKLASGEKGHFHLTVSKTSGNHETTVLSSDEIKGKVFDLSPHYSGHADKEGLLDFLFSIPGMERRGKPKSTVTVFLNHGLNSGRRALRDAILQRSKEDIPTDWRTVNRVEIPHKNSPFFDLDKDEWVS